MRKPIDISKELPNGIDEIKDDLVMDQGELNEAALNGCMSRLFEARSDLIAVGAPEGIDFNEQVRWVTRKLKSHILHKGVMDRLKKAGQGDQAR